MELKVTCNCGQKYKFDVEPVNGLMPFTVNCPACGVDGTQAANGLLTSLHPAQVVQPPASTVPTVRISIPAMAPATAAPAPMAAPHAPLRLARPKTKEKREFNLALGIVGAVAGSSVGAGLMWGFFVWANFRFPLMGTGIGALAGLGARILYKGTDSLLGIITAGIALAATVAALHFMYGDMAGMFFITMIVSAVIAWRISS